MKIWFLRQSFKMSTKMCFCVGLNFLGQEGVEAQRVGGPSPEKVGEWSSWCGWGGARRGGDPEGWRAQNFALVFPSREVFSWNCGHDPLATSQREDSAEREKKSENGSGRGKKKSDILGGPEEEGPAEGTGSG